MTVQQVNVRFVTTYSGQGTKQFQRDMSTLGGSIEKVAATSGQSFSKFGRFSQAAGTALMVGLGGALAVGIKASIDFEDAFAGVRKTVDASEGTFQTLARNLREMSTEIPIAATELARIGELGGQLGIPVTALEDFIEVIAMLGVTTNLEVDEAATAVARFTEVMGTSDAEFSNVASSLVELGNNFAATESEILTFATRLSGIGATVGLTEGDVLGLATAFTNLGEPAERGGTAVQRAFLSMFQAIQQGGDELQIFSEIMGITSEQMIEIFSEDPAEAFVLFAEGLGRIQDEGGDITTLLQDLGLGSQRALGAMLKAAAGADTLADAIDMGNQAYRDNTALTEEAEKRFGTMASQLGILKNQFFDLRVEIGDKAAPAFKDALGFFSGLLGVLKDNMGALEGVAAAVAILTGARGLVKLSGFLASTAVAAGEASIKLTGLGVAGLNAQARIAKVGGVVRGLGGALTIAIAALGLVAVGMARNRQHALDYQNAIESLVDTLEALEDGSANARDVYDSFNEVLKQKTGIFDITVDLEQYEDFVMGFGQTTHGLVDMAVNDFEEFERVTGAIVRNLENQDVGLRGEGNVSQRFTPTPEQVEAINRRNEALARWNLIIREVTAATASLRKEEEVRAAAARAEQQRTATAGGGPGAIGVGGPGEGFMRGVSSVAADIAAGILTTRDEYNEALADMLDDTADFTTDFLEDWGDFVADYNESLFDWETAWDEYESVARLSTAELNKSIDAFIEDQRNRTAALAFVYKNFGEDVGMLFATLPADLQLRLGATLDELGPAAFEAQIDTIVAGWGDMTALAVENAMIMAPTGARRAFEEWTGAFDELMAGMPEHAAEGSQAWMDAVMANFEEFRIGLAEESPELSAAFDELVTAALEELQKDRPLIDLDATIAGMTTEEKIKKFRDMGLSWVDAVMLAWGTLPDRMGETAGKAATRTKTDFGHGIEAGSPSRVFMDFGRFSAQGFEMGFMAGMDKINFKPNRPVFQLEAPAQTPVNGPSITIINPQHKDDDVLDGIKRASALVGLTRAAETTPGFG